MGVNKDTKIFYLHNATRSGFSSGTGTVEEDDDDGYITYTFRNKANDADVIYRGRYIDLIDEVFEQLIQEHGKNPNTKDPYPETILPLIVHDNVDTAKATIFDAAVLTAFDTHCDRQEWALVDNNKGLKMTRDWKIEMDPTADDHYKQFKDAMDGRWVTYEYLKIGGILTDSDSHLF
tara:strand:+ start:64 stop:594 length:531 start_codon:yes stop_codon:yes gene_type:complete